MTWSELETQRRVVKEPTTKSEIDELRALAARNLRDAALPQLSADGRFSMAYNAARTLAIVSIRVCGYRVKQFGGAHYNTFLALPTAMGASHDTLAMYFDGCRQTRNDLSYGAASVVSDSDADELCTMTAEFRDAVEAWLRANHPALI
ncbi:MAG: hypothetical protein AB1716_15595 [Planctomycetota bacterium]